jgi:excisionase family DNA binding protein
MHDRLVDIAETAVILGRTENAVRRMVERRQIPFRKSGRRVLFRESELRAFIDALPGVTLDDVRQRQEAGVA